MISSGRKEELFEELAFVEGNETTVIMSPLLALLISIAC